MADAPTACLAGLLALAFFAVLGAPLARRLFPATASSSAFAPILGWAAIHGVASPIFAVTGFGPAGVAFLAFALVLWAAVDLRGLGARKPRDAARDPAVPPAAYGLALAVAGVCAATLLPKAVADGVVVAAPIFDHSKVAIADAIARTGAPPHNPFYAEAGEPSTLAYYYLWHLGVAVLSRLPGVDAWSADVGLTAFTAFAAFSLAMGLAVLLSRRASSAYWALALAATGSAWPALRAVLGPDALSGWISDYAGLEPLLVQAVWAPQHLASAGCVVAAALLIERLSRSPDALGALALGLTAAAGFGSSVWVGGVVFAAVGLLVGAVSVAKTEPRLRLRFAICCFAAAVAAAIFASPILAVQAGAAAAREGGVPIALHVFETLGRDIPETVRRLLDPPAFWAVRLPLDAPAIVLIGAGGFWSLARGAQARERDLVSPLACTAVAGLVVGWLLISTVLNNDLGWRAALPPFLVLSAVGGAALARGAASGRRLVFAAGAALAVGLFGAAVFLRDNASGRPFEEAAAFAQSPAVWAAVRRQSAPDERVVDNPLLFAGATPWPANLSWALFADRPSCYAGFEFARPFAPAPRGRIDAVDQAFVDLFAGRSGNGHALLKAHDCRLIVLHRSDGAYRRDPFADDPRFLRLQAPDGWRVYRVL